MENHNSAFEKDSFCAGFNKALKLIGAGNAHKAYLASDADESIACRVKAACLRQGIECSERYNKKTLGKMCGLEVSCAVVVLLKKDDKTDA